MTMFFWSLLAVTITAAAIFVVTHNAFAAIVFGVNLGTMLLLFSLAGVFDRATCGYGYYYAVSAKYPISTRFCTDGVCNTEAIDRAAAQISELRKAASRMTDACVKSAMLDHASYTERDVDYARQRAATQQRVEAAMKQTEARP